MRDVPTLLWRIAAGLMCIFMVSPLIILVIFCFSEKSVMTLPITGLTFDWFIELFNRPAFWLAFKNSCIVTGTVGGVSTVIGTMAASALVRLPSGVSGTTMYLLTLPVMTPPLMLAIALLTYYTSVGFPLGLRSVILSHLIYTQPFVILIVHARLIGLDPTIINSARDLGASPIRAFFTITLPIIRPTLIGATLIAMALSLDDFVITFFTIGGGNTLPTFMWGMLRKGVNPTINIIATVLLLLTISVSFIALRATRYRG